MITKETKIFTTTVYNFEPCCVNLNLAMISHLITFLPSSGEVKLSTAGYRPPRNGDFDVNKPSFIIYFCPYCGKKFQI